MRVGRGTQNWRRMVCRTTRMDMDTPTPTMLNAIPEIKATHRHQDDPPSSVRRTKTTAGCSPNECLISTATLTTCLTSTTNHSLRDLRSIPCQTLLLRRCRRSNSTLSYITDPPLLRICRCIPILKHILRCRIRTARIISILRQRQTCPLPTFHQSSMPNPLAIHRRLEFKVPPWDRKNCRKPTNIRTIITQVRR